MFRMMLYTLLICSWDTTKLFGVVVTKLRVGYLIT